MIRLLDPFNYNLSNGDKVGSVLVRLFDLSDTGCAFPAPQQLLQWLSPADNSGFDSKSKHGEPDVCLDGTRVPLLEAIDQWFNDPYGKPFFWLSGLAGTGKSTISRTVAKYLKSRDELGGNFFFSRWEFNITDPFVVFPTLAYQLSLYDDSFFQNVYESRKSAHDVPKSRSLERQFTELILKPLSTSQFRQKTVGIIIDAVDEGQDGMDIIPYLCKLPASPCLKVFVTSREEPDPSLGFHHFQLHNIEDSIIQQDLTLYLSSQLGKLRPPDVATPWPSPEDLEILVAKADRLFVYAATVVKFVGNRQWSDPQEQLERLLLTTNANTSSSPWRDLDDMYSKIVKDAIGEEMDEDLVARFKLVVGSIILLQSPLSVTSMEALLGKKVFPAVKMLRSVFLVPEEQDADTRSIPSFHPSFPEFLLHRCPQDPFSIDEQMHHAVLAKLCLRCISGIEEHPLLEGRPIPEHIIYACYHLGDHLSRASTDAALLEALNAFGWQHLLRWAELLIHIRCDDRVTRSLCQFRQWAVSLLLTPGRGQC